MQNENSEIFIKKPKREIKKKSQGKLYKKLPRTIYIHQHLHNLVQENRINLTKFIEIKLVEFFRSKGMLHYNLPKRMNDRLEFFHEFKQFDFQDEPESSYDDID